MDSGDRVKIIVRSVAKLPKPIHNHERPSVIEAYLLELSDAEHVKGCDAVASCLGHNLTW